MGELFLFQGPWHMTHRRHRAGVICLCELCDDSGARTPASHIILVKIYINEEKLTHGKVVLRWNVKLQRLQMCSGCIYRLLRNYYISSCLCVYSRSELHHNIVSNVLFFFPLCVSLRQTSFTPGLLFTGDVRKRRETEAVSITSSGNTLHPSLARDTAPRMR